MRGRKTQTIKVTKILKKNDERITTQNEGREEKKNVTPVATSSKV